MASTHTFLFKPHGKATLQLAVVTPPALRGWIRETLASATPHIKLFQKAKAWHIALRVAGKAESMATNKAFRQKDYAPDVLTFPLWERGYAGDILLGWPTVVAAAKAQKKPLKAHVQHLVIHALLHLAGEDHQTPAQAKKMEAQEVALLAALGWPDPYFIG